jgi:hypothetical protein
VTIAQFTYNHNYNTADEIAFLTGLLTGKATNRQFRCTNGWAGRGANPEAFIRYARLVMSGTRAYDPTVDLAEVRAAIARMAPPEELA